MASITAAADMASGRAQTAHRAPAAALSAQPAGAAGLHRHPDPVLHRRLLLDAALPAESSGHCKGFIWRRQLHQLPDRRRLLEHGRGLAGLCRADGRHRAAARARHRAAAAKADALQQSRLDPPAAAADDRAGARRADVEADDQPRFRHSQLSRLARRHQRLQLGLRPAARRCSPWSWSTSGSTRPSS